MTAAAPALSRSFQPTQLRGVDRDGRTVDIVASDFSLDSYNTRIDPNGWELEQFRRNPVICLQHDSYSGLPVAAAIPETVRVENGKLLMRVQFPPQGTSADADEAFGLIGSGILRGVSVGFDAVEYDDKPEQQPDGTTLNVRVYRRQRLMEVSFVTIPSNDNGLVVRARELNADPEEIRKQTVGLEVALEKRQPAETQEQKMHREYFERKKPANKESTKVLKRFFELRGETQPDDEVAAWKRMAELIETPPEVKAEEPAPAEKPPEETPPAPETKVEEEPAPQPTPPAPAAPEPERKASVHVPVEVLLALPQNLTRALVDVAVAALQRGLPVKDALALIDGSEKAVSTSLSAHVHGNPH